MSVKQKWVTATKKSSVLKRPPETVAAVFPDTKKGERAYQALQDALRDHSQSKIERLPFEKLDFGDLDMLEKFYGAPVVVVDVTERQYEACLYYQLGIRESFGMKHNIVTCVDQQGAYLAGRKGSILPADQVSRTYSKHSIQAIKNKLSPLEHSPVDTLLIGVWLCYLPKAI